MRLALLPVSALALLTLASCGQTATTVTAAPHAADICATPETGLIIPTAAGVTESKLEGPFLLKSLSVGVDPANPNQGGSVLWSGKSVWISISNFKGEFYLPRGDTLSAQPNFSPWKTVYSGCRLE
jgi:hypothetical protein